MHNEYLNVFDRRANANLAEDRKNRFEQHDALRAKQRAASNTQDARAQRRAEQRANWVGPGRPDIRTASGIKVTDDLRKLKEASDADRVSSISPKAEIPQPSEEDVLALANHFMATTPEYVPTLLNGSNLLNAVCTAIAQGRLATFSVENFRKAFHWLRANGYIEEVPSDGVRKLSDARRAPTKIYPPFVDPEQQEDDNWHARMRTALADREMAKRARTLPFAELQREVREGNPKFGTRQELI